jgi:hypothetical protein
MPTAVEALIQRQDAVLAFLRDNGQLSLAIDFEESYRPLLVLACGSFFETHLTDHLCAFARAVSDPRIAEFLKNKALKRQYHSLFNWEQANINQFLGLFGEEYKAAISGAINSDEKLVRGMRNFLQLGSERNKVAHSNLSALSPDLTIDEIKQRYSDAWVFLQFLCSTLNAVRPAQDLAAPAPGAQLGK